MKYTGCLIALLFFILPYGTAGAQSVEGRLQEKVWTMSDVIRRARTSSPDALAARHTFRSAYWDYRSYKADYLPSLTLTSAPNLNRAINQVTMGDGTVKFVEQNMLNTDLSLMLNQNISWTGGSLFLESSLQRVDLLNERSSRG